MNCKFFSLILFFAFCSSCAGAQKDAAYPATTPPIHNAHASELAQLYDKLRYDQRKLDRYRSKAPIAVSTDSAKGGEDPTGAQDDAAEPIVETSAASRSGSISRHRKAAAQKPPPAAQSCEEVCTLADSICHNAKRVCELADEILREEGEGDAADWAKGICTSSNQRCEQSRKRCEGCS